MKSPQQEQLSQISLSFQDAAIVLGNAFKSLAAQVAHITKALQGIKEELEPKEAEWWPLHISADGGGFGRFRWFNGSDEFWGDCWWDNDLPWRSNSKPTQTINPLITCNPSIRFGKPCITGTRISVDDIKQYVASGMSQDEILADFPDLKPEHIQAAIAYQGPTLHGLFSEQAANQFGSSIYKTPDGREVEVTNVYSSEVAEPMYGWADKVHVGEVKEWLRGGRPGTLLRTETFFIF